jgi:hypothetical protein
MPGVVPTRAEVEDRIEAAGQFWAAGLTTGQLKTAMREKFGSLDHATCLRYLARARKRWAAEMALTPRQRQAQRGEAIEFYRQRLRDSKTSDRVKVMARERIDSLLGLDAPIRTELSGPDGKPIAVEAVKRVPIDFGAMDRIQRRLLGVPDPDGNGESVHPAPPDATPGGGVGGNGH